MKDPIVEDLHRIRRDIAEECEHDFAKMLEWQQQVHNQREGPRVKYEQQARADARRARVAEREGGYSVEGEQPEQM